MAKEAPIRDLRNRGDANRDILALRWSIRAMRRNQIGRKCTDAWNFLQIELRFVSIPEQKETYRNSEPPNIRLFYDTMGDLGVTEKRRDTAKPAGHRRIVSSTSVVKMSDAPPIMFILF